VVLDLLASSQHSLQTFSAAITITETEYLLFYTALELNQSLYHYNFRCSTLGRPLNMKENCILMPLRATRRIPDRGKLGVQRTVTYM
jgi:hypothetical protein